MRCGAVRILVVDADLKLAHFVRRALSAEGYDVDVATGGAHALSLLEGCHYELVVLDLLMQDVDGMSILESALRSDPDLRILVLSAIPDVESKVRCFELGATDHMTKPFALAELKARIRARLGSPVSNGHEFLRHNGFELDLQRRIVITKQGTVRLSDREFLLLRHLLRCQGEVCSRTELLQEVWGCPFDPGTNVVDVYVGRLRAKLGRSVITTVRNAGYYVPVA